ncbi:MAG: type II toxin-antitoxin system RelE/ParE family toxin [Acidithiobacillus ferrivorans]
MNKDKLASLDVVWTAPAWQQYQDAMARLAEDRPQSALIQDEAITAAVARLGSYSRMGRLGRRRGTRELVVAGTPFIVVYRIQEHEAHQIQVIRFLHGAQQWS